MDKIIYKSVKLNCNAQKAFEMFTENHNLEKWLTQLADVEPKMSGKYELFWNPEDRESDSTIGCKVLAIESGKFLAFEWKGPKPFKHFMNSAKPLTHVIAFFIASAKGTEVHLLHTGWRDSAEWDEARRWFEKAWTKALEELQKYANMA
jgi:uncharacterized protein YndB with AHSA1/START domain